MQRKQYRIRLELTTPAFLHGADVRRAEWRIPPLRALLRYWWRMAWAADRRRSGRPLDVADLWREEQELFGGVHDDQARRSRIRLSMLDQHCEQGKWPTDAFRQVQRLFESTRGADAARSRNGPGSRSSTSRSSSRGTPRADLYLGFGPRAHKEAPGETSVLLPGSWIDVCLQYCGLTAQQEAQVQAAMFLVHVNGTVGGRSGNAWGSITVTDHALLKEWSERDDVAMLVAAVAIERQQAFETDWSTGVVDRLWMRSPHARGHGSHAQSGDSKSSGPVPDWIDAINELGSLAYTIRQEVGALVTADAGARVNIVRDGLLDKDLIRLWLGGPSSSRGDWSRVRWAGQLRFKVRQTKKRGTRIQVIHLPASPPGPVRKAIREKVGKRRLQAFLAARDDVWDTVYRTLDRWQEQGRKDDDG